MSCLWTGYFQDNSRKHVAIVPEDKSVSQKMAKKLLHKLRDMATVFNHLWARFKSYIKLSSRIVKPSNKTGKKDSIAI